MSTVESLGKYTIRRQLGRGAMGTVYEAFDPVIERVVAIKTVRLPETPDEETAEEIARFRREAQAAGRLTHPNIVGVFDYGETKDLAYIVMEYVDGPPLKALLDKNERFPLPRIVQIMEDLLTGLQYSHERGVVHRDIKPANLMLTKAGQAKIADFGIARIESSSMTQAGTVLGTPAYMSPEQFMGLVVDARTDIYSSGVLLYQLLTGERPFEGSMSAIMHKALNTEAPAPSEISVTAPRPFDGIVRKAMAKRPEDRYASASQFLAAIRAAATAPPPPPVEADDEGEATMVAVPRPARPPPRDATGTIPPRRGAVASPAADVVAAKGTAAAAKSSKMPLIAGGGAVGLAILGGLGYFLLAGHQSATDNRVPDQHTADQGTGGQRTAEQQAADQRAADQRAADQRAADQRAADQRANDQRTAEQKAADQRAADQRAADQRAADQRAAEQRAADQRAADQRAAEQRSAAARVEAATRTDLTAFLSGLNCSLIDGDVRDGTVLANGIAGKAAVDALRQKIAFDPAHMASTLKIAQVNTKFCDWLNLLRPVADARDPGPPLGLRLAGDPPVLYTNDFLRPHATMPGFRGEMHVDYISSDGSVAHLYPQRPDPTNHIAGDPPRTFAPGEELAMGEGPYDANNQGWTVNEPYGTDVIVAIATDVPLFDRPRPKNAEDVPATYLRDLKRAIDALRARGGRIAIAAIPVETRKR